MKKSTIIKCPKCGREYLAGEIFIPKYFVGQPKDVIKGFEGNILTYEGEDMDLTEEYICDGCNTKFLIKAQVNFKTELAKDVFDDEEYVSKGE